MTRQSKWKIRNPEKNCAHVRIGKLRLLGRFLNIKYCQICRMDEPEIFHHENYQTDKGLLICLDCHLQEHGK